MKRVIWAAAIMVAMSTLCVPQTTAAWTTFHSPKCRLSVDFPTTPSVKQLSEGGMPLWVFQLATNRAVYTVSCMIFPPELRPRGMEYLRKSTADAVKGSNGTMSDEKETSVQGFPAIAYTNKGSVEGEELVAYAQNILAGQYQYQVIVVTQPRRVQVQMKGEVERFFSSLAIDADKQP